MNEAAMWAERDAIALLVEESPTTATVNRVVLVPDTINGGLKPDPFGAVETVTVRFRIAHETRTPPTSRVQNDAFFTTNYNRIATWAWNTEIREGDVYTDPDINKQFSFGRVDVLRKFGGVVGHQSSILEAETID